MTSNGVHAGPVAAGPQRTVYVALDGTLMSAPVAPSPDGKTLTIGAPAALFRTDILRIEPSGDINGQSYEVSPDGGRFLILAGGEGPPPVPISLILNWKPKWE